MENKIIIDKVLDLGAFKASVIPACEIKTDRIFRDICLSNGCGMCGKCYMCPPDCGEIDDLIRRALDGRPLEEDDTTPDTVDSADAQSAPAAPAVPLTAKPSKPWNSP